jgi:two-component system response regulator MtrA
MIETAPPDLVVLDLMLPEFGGQRVLRSLRDQGRVTPVLVLTAKNDEDDKVRLLKLGADDYVTKPFGSRELVARIEALLRRARPHHKPADHAAVAIRFGDVVVDARTRIVTRSGAPVSLTPKEFDLLLALARRQGAVVSRAELLHEVWGYQADVVSRTVDLHVLELRRKLEVDPAEPRHIVTVRKVGYRLVG